MAVKKSQLYSTLWEGCNQLRGGMEPSQYKDYVLVILFLKYISDKVKTDDSFIISVPEGCTFGDIVQHKNKADIGEKINKALYAIAKENALEDIINNADFCDENKLGRGKDLVDRVSKLVGVFENPNLDFSNNRAADDDLLGDAYEYLMRLFAAKSGQSKGQFYTPAEVSRVMAKVIGIGADTRPQISIYDPTCGSGSLLLRAKAEANTNASVNGQESLNTTKGLAEMNMILHGVDTATLHLGDTINDPQDKINDTELQTFDYVVANPPFSQADWLKSAGVTDKFGRWGGVIPLPPAKNGDFAFLLHIIKSMKYNGHGACILPHGVLFRGGSEYEIRKYLIDTLGCISGIIGLPTNLFYGTGIPASIIVLDKNDAATRNGIFFIDAKDGFRKDGNKNRLREQDIKRIVDCWKSKSEVPHFSRFVSKEEIVANDYNLNIPRYIAPRDTEIIQNIDCHLAGDIPDHDIEGLDYCWKASASLRDEIFKKEESGSWSLKVAKADIAKTISGNKDFIRSCEDFTSLARQWQGWAREQMMSLGKGCAPKKLISQWSEKLLEVIRLNPGLVDPYDAYDILLNYWGETLQDDCYMVSNDGWTAPLEKPLKKSFTYDDLNCDLLPVLVVIDEFFKKDLEAITLKEGELSSLVEEKDEILESNPDGIEKNSDEEKRLKEIDKEVKKLKAEIKTAKAGLTKSVMDKYETLTPALVQELVVGRKWLASIMAAFEDEKQRLISSVASDIITLVERYEKPLPELEDKVEDMRDKVREHLAAMGFVVPIRYEK